VPYNIGIDARRLGEPVIGQYVRRLVLSLAEIDEDNIYSLFVGTNYGGEFDELPDNFLRVNERSPVYSFRERIALSWRQLRQRLDLYHSTHYILPLWVPRRTVTTVHDILHLLYPDFMPGRLSMYVAPTLIRGTLARSDSIIAQSQSTKSDLIDYFDVKPSKVVRIYPSVDLAFTPTVSEGDAALRRQLSLDKPYILFRGGPHRHKNEELTLRAFAAAITKASSEVDMVCFGERQTSPERFHHLVRTLGIEERIHWFESLGEDQLPALLRGAKLFLYPTLYDGFPMPVAEAMTCGVPVITADNPSVREIAEGAAKLIEAESVASLAGAITWCLNDQQLTANLAADGLRRAADFQRSRVAHQTRQVYESALANGRRAAGAGGSDG
jgi:alpha-1,3-rhamnosyl/mannosyltransferase